MPDPNEPQDPCSVLMVDDTPANLELLFGMLKGKDCRVRAAVSGKLALQAARSEPPDLILLDINMPEMDGYEVCRRLKEDDRLKDIPVIFLSALNETMDKVKAFGAGGVDYITKPFQFEEVEARVRTHLELRRQKRRLQENYDRLRELESLRDSLVHMIVHDLRSPLTAACGFLGFVKADAQSVLSPGAREDIAEVDKALKKIIGIVNDVLEVSKMEEGRMRLKPVEFDLAGMAAESLSGLKSLAEGRRVEPAPDRGPVLVRADRELIARVLQNLLANALKFTTRGGCIRLDVQPAGERVRVSVADDGPGIKPEHRQKVFEKFFQVETGADRQRNSTGLGLTFCRLAVEAHGGSIGVDSEEGKGSTFWFELPVGGPPADAAAEPPRANP